MYDLYMTYVLKMATMWPKHVGATSVFEVVQ